MMMMVVMLFGKLMVVIIVDIASDGDEGGDGRVGAEKKKNVLKKETEWRSWRAEEEAYEDVI